jgi:hypothetical protein
MACPACRYIVVFNITRLALTASRRRSIMLIFIVLGTLYLVFAFREPPKVLANFFTIPILAVFFAPDRRVKLGRIIMGALLLLLGVSSQLSELYYRIFGWHGPRDGSSVVSTLLGIGIAGMWVAARWKRGGEVSEAEEAERRAQRQSFDMLKRDPRFLHLQQYLYARSYRTTFERTPDPSTYRIVYIDLWDAKWQRLLAHEGAGARLLVAYLQRGVAPRRLRVALDLPTGTCTEGEAGWMGWGGLVPLDPRSA